MAETGEVLTAREGRLRGTDSWSGSGSQLRLPLVGGRISYEQSLLLPLITREDGRRVFTEAQIRQNPELERLVHGPYRGSFKPLWHTFEYQFREPDGRGRVRVYEAPPEEGMCWIEGEPVEDQ